MNPSFFLFVTIYLRSLAEQPVGPGCWTFWWADFSLGGPYSDSPLGRFAWGISGGGSVDGGSRGLAWPVVPSGPLISFMFFGCI